MTRTAFTLIMTALIAGCAAHSAPAAEPPAPAPVPPAPVQPAPAQPAPANVGKINQDSSIDDILDALDIRGDSLKDFTADVKLQEEDAAVGNVVVRTGKLWLQRLPNEDARMRLTLDKKQVKDKTIDEKLEYVYSQGWLTDRDYRRKLNVRRQMVRPGDKVNLLKLGEGPLPLPLGQDKADVHKLFDAKKAASAKEDPANSIHLQLTPKKGTQFEKKLDAIDFWVDPQEIMPVRVQSTEGDQIKTWDLSNIKTNTNLGDRDFELEPVNQKEWQIDERPFDSQ